MLSLKTNYAYYPAFEQLFLCYCKIVPKQSEFDAVVNSSTLTPIWNPFSNTTPQITRRISTLYKKNPGFGSKEIVQISWQNHSLLFSLFNVKT